MFFFLRMPTVLAVMFLLSIMFLVVNFGFQRFLAVKFRFSRVSYRQIPIVLLSNCDWNIFFSSIKSLSLLESYFPILKFSCRQASIADYFLPLIFNFCCVSCHQIRISTFSSCVIPIFKSFLSTNFYCIAGKIQLKTLFSLSKSDWKMLTPNVNSFFVSNSNAELVFCRQIPIFHCLFTLLLDINFWFQSFFFCR